MGQKVNPIGLRLGINRGWDSVWFAKKRDYGKFLIEDYKIRDYIKKNVTNAVVSQVMIERTSKKCIVSIYTSRTGIVIGKRGSDVEKIKKNLTFYHLLNKFLLFRCYYLFLLPFFYLMKEFKLFCLFQERMEQMF